MNDEAREVTMRAWWAVLAMVAGMACAGRAPPTAVVVAAPVADAGARTSACAAVLCGPDTRCEETRGVARCVGIMRPRREPCGGFAGLRCPDGARCVDDPDDGCDPARGGRDCGGVCVPAAPDGGGGDLAPPPPLR